MTQRPTLPRLIKGLWIASALVIVGAGSAFAFSGLQQQPGRPRIALALPVAPGASPTPAASITPFFPTPTRKPYATATRWPTLTRTPTQTPIATCTPVPTMTATVTSTALVEEPPQPHIPCRVLPTATPTNETVLGKSVADRNIELFRFGTGETARLIIAGIHGGNEGNTVLLAYQLIDYVAAHPAIIPLNLTLYIVPDLNPDGYARGRTLEGRVNDNGVDLNRNWPWNWQKEWPLGGCWDYRPITSGPFALSEPETRWLYRFIYQHPEIDALISYHAAALGIFSGGVPDYRPSINLAKTLAGVSEYQYPPVDTHCTMTGDLTDWAATEHIAGVDIELHNFRDTDWEENLAILKAFLQFRGLPPPERGDGNHDPDN